MERNAISTLFGESGSLQRAVLTSLGLGVGVFCLTIIPTLSDSGHVAEDILNGTQIPIAIGLAFLAMVVTLAIRGVKLRLTEGRPAAAFFSAMMGGLFGVLAIAVTLYVGADYRLAKDLLANGVPVQANVVREFTSSCGKRSCNTDLEYSFVPQGQTAPINGFVSEGDTRRDPGKEYLYAKSTGTLPILYDPSDPRKSMVNFGEQVKRRGSFDNAMGNLELMFGLLAFCTLMFGFIVWSSAKKAAAKDIAQRSVV